MHNPYEPPAAAPTRPARRRPRPAPLLYVTGAMALSAPVSLALLDVPFGSVGFVIGAAGVLFAYFVLWHFWQGANWARWLVLADSAFGVFNLLTLGTAPRPIAVMIVLDAALSVYLLVWLNRASAKRYFSPPEALGP